MFCSHKIYEDRDSFGLHCNCLKEIATPSAFIRAWDQCVSAHVAALGGPKANFLKTGISSQKKSQRLYLWKMLMFNLNCFLTLNFLIIFLNFGPWLSFIPLNKQYAWIISCTWVFLIRSLAPRAIRNRFRLSSILGFGVIWRVEDGIIQISTYPEKKTKICEIQFSLIFFSISAAYFYKKNLIVIKYLIHLIFFFDLTNQLFIIS